MKDLNFTPKFCRIRIQLDLQEGGIKEFRLDTSLFDTLRVWRERERVLNLCLLLIK